MVSSGSMEMNKSKLLAIAGATAAAAALVLWRLQKRSSSSALPAGKEASSKGTNSSKDKDIAIYFGSQTGTAESFAQELCDEMAEKVGLEAEVIDLEEFEPEKMAEHNLVVFLVATYGEGDPTDNTVEFHRWLIDQSVETDFLNGVKFCVMGLGNKQYTFFNAMGKAVDEHMERLGAERIYQRGEGDDDDDIEEDFRQWREGGLWEALRNAVGGDAPVDSNTKSGPAPLPLEVIFAPSASELPKDPSVHGGGSDTLSKFYFQAHTATISKAYELRQKPDYANGFSTAHVDLDISKSPALRYEVADTLDILPENDPQLVEWFAQRLGVSDQLEDQIGFRKAAECTKTVVKQPFPSPCTLRKALTLYCELQVLPSKAALKRFADARFKPLLDDEKFVKELQVHSVSFQEFLIIWGAREIPIGEFLMAGPRQKSRPYTISSSSKDTPRTVSVSIGLMQERMQALPLNEWRANGWIDDKADTDLANASRVFRGCTSAWLCHADRPAIGTRCLVTVHSSTFRLPRSHKIPVVMIGAGTGLAPFRGFLREFRTTGKRPATLIFGCTRRDADYIYKDEIEAAVEEGYLEKVVCAFSREQEHKVYVQHKVAEMKDELKALLKKGAYIYICGSTSMGKSVVNELADIGNIAQLRSSKRLVEELWG